MKAILWFSLVLAIFAEAAIANEDSPCKGDETLQEEKLSMLIKASRKYFQSKGSFPEQIGDLSGELGESISLYEDEYIRFEPEEHRIALYCGLIALSNQEELSNVWCEGGLYLAEISCQVNRHYYSYDP